MDVGRDRNFTLLGFQMRVSKYPIDGELHVCILELEQILVSAYVFADVQFAF